MATFHENLVQSFHNFRDKYLKANGNFFKFSYDATTQKYGFTINGTFHPFKSVQASKTVTAGTSAQTVTPDSGYDGVASVTVNPTPSQTKSVTATTLAQTISPDSGKLLSSVTVNPQNHTETFSSTVIPVQTKISIGNVNNYHYLNFNGYFYITQLFPILYGGTAYKIYFTGGRYGADGSADTGHLNASFDGDILEYKYPFYYGIITIRVTKSGQYITKIEVKKDDTYIRYYVGLTAMHGGTTSGQWTLGDSNGIIVKTNGTYQTLWSGSIYSFYNSSGATAANQSHDVTRAVLGRFAMFAIPVPSVT